MQHSTQQNAAQHHCSAACVFPAPLSHSHSHTHLHTLTHTHSLTHSPSDPGQSLNTSVVLEQLAARSPDLLAILGDLSYADDWRDGATKLPDELQGDYSCARTVDDSSRMLPVPGHGRGCMPTYTCTLTAAVRAHAAPCHSAVQPKWDSWARLFEPLLSRVPFVHTPGNHGARSVLLQRLACRLLLRLVQASRLLTGVLGLLLLRALLLQRSRRCLAAPGTPPTTRASPWHSRAAQVS